MNDRRPLPMRLSDEEFLLYMIEQICDFGCGVTTVPFLEMQRLLGLCGVKDPLVYLEEHEEFDDGISLHSSIWSALVDVAQERRKLIATRAAYDDLLKEHRNLQDRYNESLWEKR